MNRIAPPLLLYITLMGSNNNLLCIHQDPAQLSLLKQNGFDLVIAANGPDGLRLLQSCLVDAVVLEHQPGFLDSSILAAEIKRSRPKLPIVLLVDHLELPDGALESIDALVVKSDGDHFLWATIHFILNVKPRQQLEGKLRTRPGLAAKAARNSRRSELTSLLPRDSA